MPITTALAELLGEPATGYSLLADRGFTPFADFSKAKRRLDAAIDEQRTRGLPTMPGWRLHDCGERRAR